MLMLEAVKGMAGARSFQYYNGTNTDRDAHFLTVVMTGVKGA
jgi:hypothetical protein